MQSALFVFGLVMLVMIELLRWLADMPAETGTGLSVIAWLCIAGPAALHARAGRTHPPDERGSARVGVTLGFVVLAFVAGVIASIVMPGCTRHLVLDADDDPPTFEVRRGPPCWMGLLHEGNVESSVEHKTKRCRLRIDGRETP